MNAGLRRWTPDSPCEPDRPRERRPNRHALHDGMLLDIAGVEAAFERKRAVVTRH